mgnify:CR=1 FL=1
MPTSPRHDAPILRKSPANSYCPWVDVGIDPYANLGTFRIAAQNRRIHAYYTHVFHKCHVKSVEAKDPAMAAAGRAGASGSAKIGRPLVPSQQAPGFLWQDSRRGSVSGLNCRRKERHLLQSPPSPIKTANTNKKSAQPNPTAARIHSLILERNTRSTPVPAKVRDSAQQT